MVDDEHNLTSASVRSPVPNSAVSDEELAALVPVFKKLLWADLKQRDKLQERGVNVTPVNFYSSIPSIREIKESFEYKEFAPYLSPTIFDQEALSEELRGLADHSSDFDPPVAGDEVQCTEFFWSNSQFSYSDAMAYYAYIRRIEPRRVVEIGSGFSSLVAIEALRKNKSGGLVCIEPFPRPFIERLGEAGTLELRKLKAQQLSADQLNDLLEDGDVLFIDSTHTVKSGSDCLHIYLRLLPSLRKRVMVHVHDIFLPFALPQAWLLDRQIFWTEQYLVLAFITDNPRVSVRFGSAYHHQANPNALDALMHERYPRGGGSFWFEYDGRR